MKPEKINYGLDLCHYCKMSIVDSQHASQIVTEKGKSFKYDAIECMMNHLRNWDQVSPKLYLVTTYDSPAKMVDATTAHYLVTPSIPSPMGEFLTAFEDERNRTESMEDGEGKAMDWNSLKMEFEVD